MAWLTACGDPAVTARRTRQGFTLIELLVVLAIIASLLALAAPRYFQHVDRSREAVLRENLATLRDAIDQYHADTERWPASLDALAEARYVRRVPVDPITERSDTWLSVPPPNGGEADVGIYDVRSGAEGVSIGGQPYSDF